MDVDDERILDSLTGKLNDLAGSYLQTVFYSSKYGHLCPNCGGIKEREYYLCRACHAVKSAAVQAGFPDLPVDNLGSSVYGIIPDGQMYKIMKDYKQRFDKGADNRNLLVFKSILAVGLKGHSACLVRIAGCAPTAWAVVPSSTSSRRYKKEHPLEVLVSKVMGDIPQIKLLGLKKNDHRFSLERFRIVEGATKENLSHVLLIDDSYTTGSGIQSCAGILKKAGAKIVSGYTVARLIRESMENPVVMKNFKMTVNFQRKFCPWSHKFESTSR